MADDKSDKQLKEKLFNILGKVETPRPDADKKKQALQNSMAAFDKAQFDLRQGELSQGGVASAKDSSLSKSEKKFQGLSLFSRLMGMGRVKGVPKPKGNRSVNMRNTKKAYWKYGLSTACALIAGLTFLGYQSEMTRMGRVNFDHTNGGGDGVSGVAEMVASTGSNKDGFPEYNPLSGIGAKIARSLHSDKSNYRGQPAPFNMNQQQMAQLSSNQRVAQKELLPEYKASLNKKREASGQHAARAADSMGGGVSEEELLAGDLPTGDLPMGDLPTRDLSAPLSSAAPSSQSFNARQESDVLAQAPAKGRQTAKIATPSTAMGAAPLAENIIKPFGSRAAAVPSSMASPAMDGFVGQSNTGVEADSIVAVPEIAKSKIEQGRDKFEDVEVSPVKSVAIEPVSTFSIDVDTASYSFMRRALTNGGLPPVDSIRPEELINYFNYNYSVPSDMSVPFKPSVVVTPSPWKADAKLMHIGIKGYQPLTQPDANLVFLLDVSGSMSAPDKLPLVKRSMKLLLDNLKPTDTVSIVVYAGAAGVVLDPTPVRHKAQIMNALDHLQAGGSTAGGQGLALAYQMAERNYAQGAVNRIILATDGDFNVGIRNHEELKDYVARKRDKGIFLSVLGFGQGNLNDQLMQVLAQNGNGIAAYIDTISEARKVLVTEATSSLFPIAKDVKIQVEFNPETVSEYRLVGYETRSLREEDFNNDRVDAGDIGAGHSVTAIYEFVPKGAQGYIGQRRYAPKGKAAQEKGNTDEYAFLKIRYKLPDEDTSKLIEEPITKTGNDVEVLAAQCQSNPNCMRAEIPNSETGFATAVASFAQLLKGGKYTGKFNYNDVIALAKQTKGDDVYGYRAEFIKLVELAKSANALPQ